jgi:two-component system, cell cycle sensor histidine kinase and response regulator CckA
VLQQRADYAREHRGRTMPVVFRVPQTDGSTRYLESSAFYEFRSDGSVQRVTGATRDVTEREHLLQNYRLSISAAGLATYEWTNTQGARNSPEIAKLLEIEPNKSLSNEEFYSRVHPDDLAELKRRNDELKDKRDSLTVAPLRFRFRKSDGGWRWLESASVVEFNADGALQRRVGVIRDVTREQERTEMESAERMAQESSLQRAELALRCGEIGVAEWTRDKGWFSVDSRYRNALGLEHNALPEEFETFISRIHANDRDEVLRKAQIAYDTGVVEMQAFRYRRPDGAWSYLETAARYNRSEQGDLIHMVAIVRDLTEVKAVESSLRSSVEGLNHAVQVASLELFEFDAATQQYELTVGLARRLGITNGHKISLPQMLELIHEQDRESLITQAKTQGAGEVLPQRVRLRTIDGFSTFELVATVFHDVLGRFERASGALRDISDQILVEEEIRAQLRFFEALVEQSPDAILRIDRDGRFMQVNPAFEQIFGLPLDTILGKSLEELPFSPGRVTEFRQHLDRCLNTRRGDEFDVEFANLPVGKSWLSIRYRAEVDELSNEVKFVLVFIRDITALKMAERDATASARQLGQIIETAEEGIVVVDESAHIVFANPKFDQIFGFAANEAIGWHESAFQTDGEDKQWDQRNADRKRGLSESYTHTFRRKDGSTVLCWVNAKPLIDDNGQYTGTLAMLTDVSDLDRTERDMRASMEWLEFAMESAQIAGMDFDAKTGHSRTTALFREWFGIDDARKESPLAQWLARVHPEDRVRVETQINVIIERGSNGALDFRITDHRGETRWVYAVVVAVRNIEGQSSRILATVVDISGRRKLELEREELQGHLARAQRDESLGQLAEGVAHDLNNLLTTAFGNLDLVTSFELEPDAKSTMDFVGESLTQMAALSRQLMLYAGRGSASPSAQDLNQSLDNIRSILSVAAGKRAELRVSLSSDAMPLMFEPSALQQIVVNLINNAEEATRAAAQPRIELQTRRAVRTAWPKSVQDKMDAQCTVAALITVTDNGHGMNPATLERALEPFFSTHASGRGLGLSVVDGIVRAQHGAIYIESDSGGTSVQVYLPLRGVAKVVELPTDAAKKSYRVLVVDDEATLRALLIKMLDNAGMQTLSAADGEHALSMIEQHPELDLVLLDLSMPGLDGVEVYARILSLRPKLKVVLMSGYQADSVVSRLPAGVPLPPFIHKPFRVSEMLSLAQQILG